MKNSFFFIFCLTSFVVCAQSNYQSLLWKISGNGLQEDSYLYGTMHVSSKVAYRLDDVFYTSLLKAKTIALESDPNTWLKSSYEEIQANGSDRYLYYTDGFYPQLFKLELPEEAVVRSAIRLDNAIVNAYLYRKNYNADNFEEETYLDMFIYQAAKKNKKPVVALEDLEESRYLVTRAISSPPKKTPDPWVQKLFERENPLLVQENAYRDRNLDLLDSIGSALNTEFFRENMLYKRNENMVHALDSLLKKTTVFAGVGAAHLPGEKGMIALLRQRGYRVTPLESKQTNYTKTRKELLEKTFVETPLTLESTPDNFITLKSFNTLWELDYLGQQFHIALDVTNGAYLAVTRINTFDYLSDKEKITLDKIDDLLYEDIPGTILKKEKITTPFPGIRIWNKTKKGDYQQYHIYRTPLEVIIIKLGGRLDYVLNNADAIFSSITFRESNTNWKTLRAASEKYQLALPQNYTIKNYLNKGKKLIQSYADDEYFFFQEVPVYDVNYIEEDDFEAAYLHETFYKNYDLKEAKGAFIDSDYSSYESSARRTESGKRALYLKTIVKDDNYYMMGYEGENEASARRFFNSFQFNSTSKESRFETVKDTALHFSVISNTRPGFPGTGTITGFRKKVKPYEQREKQTAYTTTYNEKIAVTRKKFHDLQMYEHIDSVWAEIDSSYKEDFLITDRQKAHSNDVYTYAFKLRDTGSIKYIRVKNILKKGILYELKTVEDTLAAPSEFVTRFYDTFTPADTLLGKDVFADKTSQFFDALQRNDSIVLKASRRIKFSKKDTDRLIDILSTYQFPDDRKFIKQDLIKALGKLKNDKIPAYLTALYLKSYTDPKAQTTILSIFLKQNNESAYKQVLELLESDFPLDAVGVRTLFTKQKKSLKLKKNLFPELLNYVTIEEYKKPVYELLATLKDSNYIRIKDYKRYKSQILNHAKVEVKRNVGKSKRNTFKRNTYLLEYYVKLLFPFRKDKKVAMFFNNVLDSDDKHALTTYYVLLYGEKESIPQKLIEKTLENKKHLYVLAEKLQENKLISTARQISQSAFARSKAFENVRYNPSTDSITFIRKSTLTVDALKNPLTVYFYKLKRVSEYSSDNYHFHYIAFEGKSNLNVKPYTVSNINGIYIKPTKTIDEYIAEALTAIKHKTRRRITLKDNQFRYPNTN